MGRFNMSPVSKIMNGFSVHMYRASDMDSSMIRHNRRNPNLSRPSVSNTIHWNHQSRAHTASRGL